jgi:di/tricarboxylate transporter
MNFELGIVAAILAGALILFVWDRWRYDLVAVAALLAAVAAGVVPAEEAFTGFADPAVVTVAAVLVISASIRKSGLLDIVLRGLSPIIEKPRLQVAVFVVMVTALSGFINNVGALALFLPMAIQSARKAGRPPSELLMPIAFGSLLGGLLTLIGTPPNILISAVRRQFSGEPFHMFDFTPVGLGIAVVGVLFLSFGWRLIPRGRQGLASPEESFKIVDYLTEISVPADTPLVGKSLADLQALAEGDVTVLAVIRSDSRRLVPSPRYKIEADDVIVLETDPAALKKVIDSAKVKLVGDEEISLEHVRSEEIGVIEAVVTSESPLVGWSPAAFSLRARHGVNLLAIRRSGRRVDERLNRVRFTPGDVVVLQGNLDHMTETLAALGCLPLADRKLQLGAPARMFLPMGLLAVAVAFTVAGLVPASVAFVGAVLAIAALRLLPLPDLYSSVDWPVVVLLGAMIPVTQALQTTGGTDLIAGWIAGAGGAISPMMLIGLVMVATMLVTPILNNAATVLLMGPIAATLAQRLDYDMDPFLMAVAVGASCDFLTPIGHQSNTLVMGPGGYRFSDYWRLGLPISILVVLVGVPLISLVWPVR